MALVSNLLVQIELFAILAISFNLLLGFSGLFSISQAAFYGIGAYAAGIAATAYGINPFLAMIIGAIVTGAIGLLIGAITVRVTGAYTVVATLGFQIIASAAFMNLGVTGGSNGLSGIPMFNLAGITIAPNFAFVGFGAAVLVVCWFVAWRIVNSSFGLILRAMRDDELATNAVGKNTRSAKLLVFTISAMMAGVAGSLLGGYSSFISPDMFNLATSVMIFTIVVLGGTGTIAGGLVGAAILVGIPQLLTFLPLPIGAGAYLQQAIYALLVLVFLLLRPQGILGKYAAVTRAEIDSGGGPNEPREPASAALAAVDAE